MNDTDPENFFIGFGDIDDFPKFKKLQSTILPDVQPIDQQKYQKLLNNKEILICKSKDEVFVGFVVMRSDGDFGYLRQLAIAPNFRRLGLASLLVKASHNWFKERELEKVKVFVKRHNKPALELYRKFGYSITSRLFQYIIQWSNLPSASLLDGLRPLKPNEDQLAAQKYNIHLSVLKNYREHDSSINLGLFENGITGFMRLRPDFPVITPIFLDSPEQIIPVLVTIREKYANPKFDHIRITKETGNSSYYQALFETSSWAKLNFVLVRMEIELNSRDDKN